jgi:hypothetical protein
VIAGVEELRDSGEYGAELGQLRKFPVVEEVEQGRLVDRNGADQLRASHGEAQGDRSAPRCSGHVHGLHTQRLDEASQVGDVVVDAARRRRQDAAAVAAPVVGDDLERPRQRGPDGVPGASVDPGTVHEDERLACAAALVVQAGFVEGR